MNKIEVLDKLAKEKGFPDWKALSEGKDKQETPSLVSNVLSLVASQKETERVFKKETVERAVEIALEGEKK